ncbi:MAG TPA: DUF222 domain-containing protein [Vicinamibacterales bacterium]|jgi:hypothetical protein|nr:DUF222 domain-containing protein [Vicinamibacterales bacterium]
MTPALLSSNERTTIEQLGEAIADIAAGIHASTYQLLVLLHDFDERKGWNNGFLSCAHWLSWRTSIDMGAAREKVRVARALPALPLLSGALQRGEISYAKVRALTRIATPATDERLLAIAHHGTASQVERLVRAWRWCERGEDDRKHLWRSVSCVVDEDGMVVLRARLTAEQGAVVQRALEAASDRLYQASRATAPDRIEEEVTSDQRRADALTLMAEAALNADLDRGSAGDRYQVVLHVETVRTPVVPETPPVLELADGPISVSAETSRRLSCDASVVVVTEGADGSVLDVGRKTRTVPAPIRRALTARDKRCLFPGCHARRCDAHHIDHWADGGPTALDNLILVCRRHHRLLHEGGFTVERTVDGDAVFRRPDGRFIEVSPPNAWTGAGVVPAGVTGRSLRVWDGTPFNVGYAIDVLHPRANPSA